MDRLIALDTVPFANRDIAPGSGTPQYATDGDPTASPPVPATQWPAYIFNAIQDELLNVIVGAGLTPDRNNWAQLLQAIQLLRPPTLVGPRATTKLTANLDPAGASLTMTADEIMVAASLGGAGTVLASFNEVLDVATTGAGGMDTGAAPASGFVAVYAICDPSGATKALLGTIACEGSVYTGGNMPAGYTQSSLVAIWPTDGGGNLVAGNLVDNEFYYGQGSAALSGGSATSATAISLTTTVPAAARAVYASFTALEGSSVTSNSYAHFGCTSNHLNQVFVDSVVVSGLGESQEWLPLAIAQTAYYAVGQATLAAGMDVLGYRI